MRPRTWLVGDGLLLACYGYYIAYWGGELGVLPPALAAMSLPYRGAAVSALMLAIVVPLAVAAAFAILWYIDRTAQG